MAVAGAHATAEDRAASVPAQRARSIAGELAGAEGRALLYAFYRLATNAGYTAVDVDARTAAAAVEAAMIDGRVLLVSGDTPALRDDDTTAISDFRETSEDKLARQAMAGRLEIPFEGRRYRVVPFARFRTVGLSNFRVVPSQEARGVIERLGARVSSQEERAVWMDVAENLSANGRSGGLVLMHDRPSGEWEPRRSEEPPLTPSQLRSKIAPTDWIQVDVKYEDGTPYDGTCSILLPDGRKIDGTPDQDGTLRFDGIDPGSCTITFPDLDEPAVTPS